MKYALAICLVLVGVALVGCGGESAHYNVGNVIQRDYEPAHTDMVMQQQYAGQNCYTTSSGSRSCSPNYVTVMVPEYVAARWSIRVENCNVKHKDGTDWLNKDGSHKCFHKWLRVDETTYNATEVGQEMHF